MRDQVIESLQRRIPPLRNGERIVVGFMPPGGTFRNISYTSFDAAADGVLDLSPRGNVWPGTGSFLPGAGRTKADVAQKNCIYCDLDVDETGANSSKYLTKAAALQGLLTFVKAANLRPTEILDSGHGIQAFWTLDTAVDAAAWQALADQFEVVALRHELKLDRQVTRDAARVLRIAGGINFKAKPVPVTLLRTGSVLALAEFREKLQALRGSDPMARPLDHPARKKLNSDLDYAPDFPKVSGHAVAEQCQQIRWFKETGSEGDYEHWFLSAGTVKHSLEGGALSHEWSAVAGGYSEVETQQKLDSSFKQGPALCESFKSCRPEGCQGCRFAGKIKTPLQAGREGAVEKIETATEGAAYLERFTVVPVGADVLP